MRSRLMIGVAALALVIAGGAVPADLTVAAAAPSAGPAPTRRACDSAVGQRGRFECMAVVRTTADGTPLTAPASSSTPPPGYGPAQIQSAYQLAAAATSRGSDQTVAIVDAYDDPTAEADLATYRSQYGLPPCPSDNGCFRKVNQDGQPAPLPPPDSSWAIEISLDVDMVSAACPRCHILLVEANDNDGTNLGASVATAAELGATQISNSWGAPEFAGEGALNPFFDHPGIMITAAAGDAGYGVNYPAASADVTAVGGTSLFPSSSSRGWAETAWAGTGSGCSTQMAKPAWQHDACTHRTANDVAAVADPDTPVAVYDTYGVAGWARLGGTSVATPIVAAVYALIGHATGGSSYFYEHRSQLYDVTSGAGATCSPSYLCSATAGYDAPTGLGTPDLTGAADTGGSCTSGWSTTPAQAAPDLEQVMTSAVPITYNLGITALSPSDVWTVGTYDDTDSSGPVASSGRVTSIEHWDGTKWSHVPSPTPITPNGVSPSEFTSVSFDRPTDGWAVGDDSDGAVLAAHWDGARWSLTPALNPTATYVTAGGDTVAATAQATAVAAISPSDAWLAAASQNGAFLEHWDGTGWTIVNVPDVGTGPYVLASLHAFSTADVWAVGYHMDPTGAKVDPVILHWDGHVWTPSQPAASDEHSALEAVSGSSPTDLWAVGTAIDPAVGGLVPFTEHWDGTAWTVVPTVDGGSVASNQTLLLSVAATSPSNAWAVGTYAGIRSGQTELRLYLLEHWDGHAWTIVGAPQSSVPDGLLAISASSASNAWIAGSQQLSTPYGFADYPFTLRSGCRNG